MKVKHLEALIDKLEQKQNLANYVNKHMKQRLTLNIRQRFLMRQHPDFHHKIRFINQLLEQLVCNYF